ncbi:MAG: AAA family ATPase [Rhodospirillales bacterium]
MIAENQDEAIDFLSSPESFGSAAKPVQRVDTHISIVFLAGDRAYKLKRAIRMPYLDFSTLELRRAACLAEVEVNRRTAPGIYLGVKAVTRGGGGELELGGEGEAVEWLVEMSRFDEDMLFDRMARRGELVRSDMENLAGEIAGFHGSAEVRADCGGASGIAAIIKNNAECFAECAQGIADDAKVGRLDELSRDLLERLSPFLGARAETGFVRHCHGDLHLRNIVMIDGAPTLFDAIEFNREFTDIDVLYDLAFLLMDLEHRSLRRLASIAFNRYLDITGDVEGIRALGLFLSVRAAIRSHVAMFAAGLSGPDDAGLRRAEACDYLDLALNFLSSPHSPRLIAVGGLSGSGKSRLARELAPFLGSAPGAVVVRSDAVRKRLAGVSVLSRLGPEGYTREMSERTYRAMFDDVRVALKSGFQVITDCVFAKPEQRHDIAAVAAGAGVEFHGLWLEAPVEVREARVAGRLKNVSDATPEVIRRQLGYATGPIEWDRVDSSGSRDETLNRGLGLIGPDPA